MTNLQPGPEMDAAVARALGWRQELKGVRHIWIMPDGFTEISWPENWSTDDACAVRDVLPEIERRGWVWELMSNLSLPYAAHILNRSSMLLGYCRAPKLAEAICRAFLAAVEETT